MSELPKRPVPLARYGEEDDYPGGCAGLVAAMVVGALFWALAGAVFFGLRWLFS